MSKRCNFSHIKFPNYQLRFFSKFLRYKHLIYVFNLPKYHAVVFTGTHQTRTVKKKTIHGSHQNIMLFPLICRWIYDILDIKTHLYDKKTITLSSFKKNNCLTTTHFGKNNDGICTRKIVDFSRISIKARSCQSSSASHVDQRDISRCTALYISALVGIISK